MCPLSLISIVLLTLAIFYVKDIVVTIIAGGIILYILLHFKRETFVVETDPQLTGLERPLWGPLYPMESKNIKDHQYYTMSGLPWCSPPLGPTEEGASICNSRTVPRISEIPYEMDKI